jgi:bacteriorhodopsin
MDSTDVVTPATPPEFQLATKTGHTALWVVFALMLFSSGAFTFLSWRIPLPKRLFHVLTTLITIIAALSYFAMATGQGRRMSCTRTTDSHHEVPDTHHIVCRSVYWARYVDWALTTPLLVADLALLAGLPGANTLMAIAGTEVMVWSGLFAAYGYGTAQKWGWFTIGCVGFLAVVWHVGLQGGMAVKARGGQSTRLFSGLGGLTLVLWVLYPM